MTEMATYQPTTVPLNNPPLDLTKIHIVFKVCQLLFSLVAFVCEEVISQCMNCAGLYIFEFVSCSAFLIGILMCVVYFTPLRNKINIPSFKKVDFYITVSVGVCFTIASIVFIATIEKSSLAHTSVVFGFFASLAFLFEVYFMLRDNYLQKQEKPKTTQNANGAAEGQPLNTPVQENQG